MRLYKLGLYEKAMPAKPSLVAKLTAARETDEKLARLDWSDAEINRLRWSIRVVGEPLVRQKLKFLNNSIEETGLPITSICLSGLQRFPLGDPDQASHPEKSRASMEKAALLAVKLAPCLPKILSARWKIAALQAVPFAFETTIR